MKKTDDYDLYDKDFNEFIRRGLDAFGMEEHPGMDGHKKQIGRDKNVRI